MCSKRREKHGKDTQQAAAEKMIKIRNSLNYDYDVGAWWGGGEGGWGGVEKRFVFRI